MANNELIKILVSLTKKELECFDEIKEDLGFRSRSVTIAHILKKFYNEYKSQVDK